MTLAIIDYGAGNLLSLTRALDAIGASARVITTPDALRVGDTVVLPGVGAAGAAMAVLHDRGFVAHLQSSPQPILGICLGMQLLFDWLAEGDCAGLGLVPGSVDRIPSGAGRKAPHMGWNRVTWGAQCALAPADFAGYFVHSYQCFPALAPAEVAWADYGDVPICAAVHHPGIIGVQFHPEKSGAAGLTLLRRAVDILSEEARG